MPDLQCFGKVGGAIQVERGLQTAMQTRCEGMERQAGVPGFYDFGLEVTQAVNLMTGFFEDFELVGLSLGTQVGDQNLAVFLVGIGVDCRNDRPALPPEHQVVTFGVALEVVIEIDAPFGVDLVMHADIIPGLRLASIIRRRMRRRYEKIDLQARCFAKEAQHGDK